MKIDPVASLVDMSIVCLWLCVCLFVVCVNRCLPVSHPLSHSVTLCLSITTFYHIGHHHNHHHHHRALATLPVKGNFFSFPLSVSSARESLSEGQRIYTKCARRILCRAMWPFLRKRTPCVCVCSCRYFPV